ncbi:helix-turn-helix domain-containing protein [Umezawaea sp. NPDC059074]|uniref:helix-turn-helix domain-containing protein n=1 Tax=Umezawaea sp. NPDC059074 TaxID=3346716 RepID=UPI0036B8E22C
MATGSPDVLVDPDRFTDRSQFGAGLTAVRERAGLSIRDLARALRIPPATAGDYCSGRTLPPARMAPVLTGFLGLCGVHDRAAVDAWQRALLRLRHDGAHTAPSPYPGFAAFDRHDARWFHGRGRLVAEARERVEDRRDTGGVVVVVGPSGSGKSSLLRAGLLPALHGWTSTVLTPTRNPCRDLSDRLCRALSLDADDLDRALHTDALTALLRQARPAHGLVVVVDQAEDLFHAPKHAVLDALAAVTAAAGVVVLGLRSDALAEAARHPLVASAAQVAVTPMSEAELREAIEAPARAAGRPLEPGLVEILVRDLAPPPARRALGEAHDPGALGLLSRSLLATWAQRRRGRVTVADHLATGGVHGAAADALAALPATAEHQFRAVLDGTWTGPLSELEPLVRARLLTVDHDGVTPVLGRALSRAVG